tara:strand:+ start:1388 stop:1765 length:378 start_codon:yes stop_codon:yes gene_type:complete
MRPNLGYSNYYWIKKDQKKAAQSELELQDDKTSMMTNTKDVKQGAANNPANLEEKPQDSLVSGEQNTLESSELVAVTRIPPATPPLGTQESSTPTPVIPMPPEVVPQSFPLVNQITSWKPQTESE